MEMEFADFIKTDELIFKHAKGMRDIYGKEFHTFHEIFIFLGGDAEFTSDKYKEKLAPGTVVIIPRGCFHQFTSENDADYHRCVFNFGAVRELDEIIGKKMNEVSIFHVSEEYRALLDALFDAAGNCPDKPESRIMAKTMLALILCTIKPQVSQKISAVHPLVGRAVEYIGRNISAQIRVEDIAGYLHISPSYLMKLFKNNMHISVYKYITEKRLVIAASEIRKGLPATKAAELVGFSDYSAFYRLYRGMFGGTPSKAAQEERR